MGIYLIFYMSIYKIYHFTIELLELFKAITINLKAHLKKLFYFETGTNLTLGGFYEHKGELWVRYTVKCTRYRVNSEIIYILKNKETLLRFSKKDIIKLNDAYINYTINKEE